MEKCLKSNVFINETVFSESAEQPVDVDFTLPDYCPDISKLLKCRAVPRIASKGLNGRTVTADGAVTITVLYADSEGKLRSYEYQYPFSRSFDLSGECPGGNLTCRTKCEYINCRAVTERKLDIHGAVGIFWRVFRKKTTEIVSDVDDSGIELKRASAPATTPVGYAEKYLLVEEELEIGQGQPPVQSLLRYDACTAVSECKIITGKLVVKGSLTVTALYRSEENERTQLFRSTVPFSQIVDMEGITEGCECDAQSEVVYIELKPRPSVTGESRSLSLNAKLLITAEGYCNNDVDVIVDAFSRKYQANIVKSDTCFDRIAECISESFHCKKNIETGTEISTVTDLWCEVQNVAARSEGYSLVMTGTVTACILACDENDSAIYIEKPVEFEYKYTMKRELQSLHCEPKITVSSCGYTLTGADSMELRIDLCINAAVYEHSVMPLVVDLTIDEGKLLERRTDSAMTIYFAAGGESVWDVARRYNAGVEEIFQINKLTDDTLEDGRMLLVPMI